MNTLIENAAAAVTMGSLALNAWHHVGFPVALKLASKVLPAPAAVALLADADLPAITVVMPACNEAAHIAAKLRNLAAIDYPADRLHVLVAATRSLRKATVGSNTPRLFQIQADATDTSLVKRIEVRRGGVLLDHRDAVRARLAELRACIECGPVVDPCAVRAGDGVPDERRGTESAAYHHRPGGRAVHGRGRRGEVRRASGQFELQLTPTALACGDDNVGSQTSQARFSHS